MRYEKTDNMLQLALEMQAARGGLSLKDIEQRFGVGRRTAMRMKDTIMRNFPQAEEVPTDERIKRWRIPAGVLDRLVNFSADELADLKMAIGLMETENLEREAASLDGLRAKLGALMRPEQARRVEPDLEALLEAEGLAMRPGPRPVIGIDVVEELRKAVKGCNVCVLSYRNREGKLNQRTVYPYGFLLGHRHYLIAYHTNPKARSFALFRLPNIEKVKVKEEFFERDPDFSLKDFSERAFGVFQEEPFDVVWRFDAESASTAREFQFHPSQTMEEQPDGSLIVRFKAGGDVEMAWHLFKWGDHVEVIEPKGLAKLIENHRPSWKALP